MPSAMEIDVDGYGAEIVFDDFKKFLSECQVIAYFEPQKNQWCLELA